MFLNLSNNSRSLPLTAIEEVGCKGEQSYSRQIVFVLSNGEQIECKLSNLDSEYWEDLIEPISDAIFDLSDMIDDAELMEPNETEIIEESGLETPEIAQVTVAVSETPVKTAVSEDTFAQKVEAFYQALHKNIRTYFYPCNRDDAKTLKRCKGALGSYAQLSIDETPYILFDNTAFGSAKDGFLLSDESIYYHNMWVVL